MERIKSHSKVEVMVTLQLTEVEARALHALTVYGSKVFLEHFYKNLGESYLKPHGKGIESLFDTIKQELPSHLDKADKARQIWN